jgi:glucose/arabinose dehydrogenase
VSRARVARGAALILGLLALVACTTTQQASPSAAGSSPSLEPSSSSLQPSASPPGSATPGTPDPSGGSSPAPSVVPPGDPGVLSLTLEPFAEDLDSPLFLTHTGDGSGRLYVVEQPGRVILLDADGGGRQTYLDIVERIDSGGERGLLGLAFHPDFASNGRLFLDYTDLNGDTVVSEFSGDAESADPSSERVLLTIEQPFPNHNGGDIAFGPDGYLYIATGDGGSGGDPFGNGQSLATHLGKMLRIDVDAGDPYAVPDDNPFVGQDGALPEIWAYGLRNPWRFAFDRQTSELYIGDVGQGAWEEIDYQPAGEGGLNYGWNTMEGPACFGRSDCDQSGLTLPITAYGRDEGSTVTGGYVYRGAAQPALAGIYFFADFGSGRIWGFPASAATSGSIEMTELLQTDLSIASFGEDEAGELYVVDLGGAVYRLAGTAEGA